MKEIEEQLFTEEEKQMDSEELALKFFREGIIENWSHFKPRTKNRAIFLFRAIGQELFPNNEVDMKEFSPSVIKQTRHLVCAKYHIPNDKYYYNFYPGVIKR